MITYRNYEKPEDLELQRVFWMEITRELPWAWKPNKTQVEFSHSLGFDPRTKSFAFEDEEIVGYMSCLKREEFIPLGYPWVLKNYEGEVREQLYEAVYGFASGPFGGMKFLQRFREEWKTQINFFLEKEFHLAFSYSIYIKEIGIKEVTPASHGYSTKILPEFSRNEFLELAPRDQRYSSENVENLHSFYSSLDFDLIMVLYDESQVISMIAVTSREDTRYSEINLTVTDDQYPKAREIILEKTVNELNKRQMKYVSTTLEENDPIIELVESFGFTQRSKSVFYSKEIM